MPSNLRRISLTVPDDVFAALEECSIMHPHLPMATLALMLLEESLIHFRYLKRVDRK